GSGPGHKARRKETRLPIVATSSGRLFLDQVGRHQSPSPLHRHPQFNMHFSQAQAKGDISTLPAGGHFYFALTSFTPSLTSLRADDTIRTLTSEIDRKPIVNRELFAQAGLTPGIARAFARNRFAAGVRAVAHRNHRRNGDR